jgi:hypothetical protein
MAVLKKRTKAKVKKMEEEVVIGDVSEEPVWKAAYTNVDPGFPVRLVHGHNHRLLLLAYDDTPPEIVQDFDSKSNCTAWVVKFGDPTLADRIEAWRKG